MLTELIKSELKRKVIMKINYFKWSDREENCVEILDSVIAKFVKISI